MARTLTHSSQGRDTRPPSQAMVVETVAARTHSHMTLTIKAYGVGLMFNHMLMRPTGERCSWKRS
eukprot:3387707-Amphidinium_carterae.1